MIRILEKHVADKIAAGEVVDRPLSVIKELLENAIDAGADTITVEIKKGGKTYMRVTDNGCGIPQDQGEIAFQRHATSKITAATDLEHIETLGFRGEALASISAVSRTELVTKTAQEATGLKLVVEGSQVAEKIATGCPDGTTIIVRDLFYNTPARRKFMKSDRAESSLIIDFVSQIALAYVHIKIRLINNGTMLFSTGGNGDRLQNILTVYSKELETNLVPVGTADAYLRLEGYVSSPGVSRANRKSQIFFINGRVVSSKVLERAIGEAYGDKLFEGRHPIAFLFLQSEPDKLDVNIHPNKREVRFHDEAFVAEFVCRALREALRSKEALPQVKQPNRKNDVLQDKYQTALKNEIRREKTEQVDIKSLLSTLRAQEDAKNASIVLEDTASYQAKAGNASGPGHMEQTNADKRQSAESGSPIPSEDGKSSKLTQDTASREQPKHLAPNPNPNPDPAAAETNGTPTDPTQPNTDPPTSGLHAQTPATTRHPKIPKPFDFDDLTLRGAIFGTYILATDATCLYLIDQHAAHERIFFEQLMTQYRQSEKLRQPILTPLTLQVSYALKENQYDWLDGLLQMGFAIEEFGPKTYIVKEIPMFMTIQEADSFLQDYLEQIKDDIHLDNLPIMEKIITRSCKSAVKARDYLSEKEIASLIQQLKDCENPFSCPHGRPTFIKLSNREIEKMFKRV